MEEFEKTINSLRVTEQFSIFITVSNSEMTFLELSTDLSGRYVSFRINPLSFKEIVELTNIKEEKYMDLLFDIFEWGSLPQRFLFNDIESRKNYISDVYDSILLKDVVDRLGITDMTSFNKILQYVLETETREFSTTNILEYLRTNNSKIDFIASKNNDIKYIQACYELSSDETIEREFGAFKEINDNNPKYVISKDKEDYSKDDIKHLNIFDFLIINVGVSMKNKKISNHLNRCNIYDCSSINYRYDDYYAN